MEQISFYIIIESLFFNLFRLNPVQYTENGNMLS